MKYSISILTYTAVEYVKRCIESVRATSQLAEIELILTANGSAEAAAYFRGITGIQTQVVENPTNLGYIDPTIHALTLARGEFFVVLNDDTIVPPGWLEMLRAPFDTDPLMAITGPENGCSTIARTPTTPEVGHEYVEFSCAMMKTADTRKRGLFDPELKFAYWEDCHESLKVREMGLHIAHVPFHIYHKRSATASRMPEIAEYQRANGAFIRRRWAHYIKCRRFDYITIIKRTAAHGDVLLATPIVRALHRRNPNSKIWFDTICPDVLKGNPRIARVGKNIPIFKDALVVDLDMAYENQPMTDIVKSYSIRAGLPQSECDPRLEIYPTDADRAFAVKEIPDAGWIAVHPGPTTWSGKNWPRERFAQLLSALGGERTVLVGGNPEYRLAATKDMRDRTTVGQLAAVIERCRMLVTVDSLPLHVAQAVGTPVVGLFGVTTPEFIFTEGSRHGAVCSDRNNESTGKRHKHAGTTMVNDTLGCMATIQVPDVLAAIRRIDEGETAFVIQNEGVKETPSDVSVDTPLRPGLSGYIPIRNGNSLDYCWQLAVKSMLPICNEVVLCDSESNDGTREEMEAWARREPKLRIVDYPWPDPKGDPWMLVKWLNHTRKFLRHRMQITLDADEVIHPGAYPEIKAAMATRSCRYFQRMNFWRDAQSLVPEGMVCGRFVVRLGPTELEMVSDNAELPSGGIPLIQQHATRHPSLLIWHLGFLRKQEPFLAKSRVMQRAVLNSFDPMLEKAERTSTPWHQLSNANMPLERFKGSHPELVRPWLTERGYL